MIMMMSELWITSQWRSMEEINQICGIYRYGPRGTDATNMNEWVSDNIWMGNENIRPSYTHQNENPSFRKIRTLSPTKCMMATWSDVNKHDTTQNISTNIPWEENIHRKLFFIIIFL